MNPEDTVLVVVDVQSAYSKAIGEWSELVENVSKLVRGFNALGAEVVALEQYPKGLGHTEEKISRHYLQPPMQKMHLSCFKHPQFKEKITELDPKTLVLCGIEAHVCVLKTALDSLKEGYETHIVCDAIASRKTTDKDVSVKRMIQEGIKPATTESALFAFIEEAGTQQFKKTQEIIK